MPLDTAAIRRQFPILGRTIGGSPLIYLDNAATTQKPKAVLQAMDRFYREENGNAHRGMHPLAEAATVAYENSRETVRAFLNAKRSDEIVFTKSATEAINLVAISLSRMGLFKEGDAIVLSMLEHHSNIVPWLQLQERKGIEIRWIDCDDEGTLKLDQLRAHLADGNVKLVSVTGQSNVLGVRPPIREIVTIAHDAGALVLVDAAQLVAHSPIDVEDLDCDFLAFSGHKLYGPTGIGVLYGKAEHLRRMPPFLGGGMMIGEVRTDGFTPADPPARFEAGSPPIAEAVGLAAAIDWLSQFSWQDIEDHEELLLNHALQTLRSVNSLHLLGPKKHSGCLSFTIDGMHPHDLTEILGREGICLRAGHHCTQPLHRRLGIKASTRLSIGIYNTKEEIDALVPALEKVKGKLTIDN